MRELPDLLFNEYHLHNTLENNLQRAREEVDDIQENDFLHADDEQILEHVFSKL